MIQNIFKSQPLVVGLAMFSMFFGAGNIIFPLAVGKYAGDQNFYAISGLILTAAVMPIAGLIAMILFDGNYKHFFGRLGAIPGFLLAVIVISLLGPLGSTPRCIALSYTTLKGSLMDMSPILFSAIACGIILVFTLKKNYILTLLGWVLTPVLLGSLFAIIVMGFTVSSPMPSLGHDKISIFLHGLKEGYNTMDLLAAFFFSSTILNILKERLREGKIEPKSYFQIAIQASIAGIALLSAVYVGFSYLAAFHAHNVDIVGSEELLGAIAMKIAGPHAGILVCVTIALACLTTAIALIAAFADFTQKEIFKEKASYEQVLIGSLLLTFAISTWEFHGISAFLGPILQICYPGLIALTVLNIAHKTMNVQMVKIPVFSTLAVSTYLYFS